MVSAPAARPAAHAIQRLRIAIGLRWLPLVGLAAYAAVLASKAAALSSASFMYSDAPEGAYLGHDLFSGATLPLHTELIPTLLSGLLLRVPASHPFVQALGPAFGVATIAVIAVAVRRLRGMWQLTAAAGLAAGPIVLSSVLFPTEHIYTLLCAAVLALILLRLPTSSTHRKLVIVAAAAGATAVVGDQSFVVVGLLPFAASTGYMWFRRRSPLLRRQVLAIIGLIAVLVAAIEVAIHVAGLNVLPNAFATAGVVGGGVEYGVSLAARTFGWMLAGQWYGTALSQPWDTLLATAGIAVPCVAPAALISHLRRADTSVGVQAWLIFWASMDVLVLAAFVLLRYAGPALSGHYLIPCFVSALATLPFLLPAREAAIGGITAALAAVQAIALAVLPATTLTWTLAPADAQRVVALLESNGLTRGYADYWASHPLTWLSGEQVHVYPVDVTGCTYEGGVCRYLYADSSWYRPQTGSSFLVVRRSARCVPRAPAGLGTPIRVISVDADTSVYVFDYDIAARFGAAESDPCI